MIKEINLIDKDDTIKRLEDFVKSFCEGDVEKYTDLIEGVNYAIAEISVTKPKAKIFEETEIDFDDTHYGYICHSCNMWVKDKTDYCPNCGAKIIESEE